jgi:hypothetical protein
MKRPHSKWVRVTTAWLEEGVGLRIWRDSRKGVILRLQGLVRGKQLLVMKKHWLRGGDKCQNKLARTLEALIYCA